MEDFTYKFQAVRGVQNGRCFYQATVPCKALASILKLDDDSDVNSRSQRLVSKPRAHAVKKYLVEAEKNEGFFVIPPLVGFIEGQCDFVEVPLDTYRNIGHMVVPIDSRIMLFDGQHRAYGIREALEGTIELGSEYVSIMFFPSMTLEERKQAFHDINYTQKTPAAAICVAYNVRNEFDKMVVEVFSQSALEGYIEYEKNTASGKSGKVFSLKSLKDFSALLLGKNYDDESKAWLTEYFAALLNVIPIKSKITGMEILQMDSGDFDTPPAAEIRESFIYGHVVFLKALALLGKALLNEVGEKWFSSLEKLKTNDLHKLDECWVGRCVTPQGKMLSNQAAVRLTYYQLKRLCDLELTQEEAEDEDKNLIREDA